ncbi:MAG TPA: sensor histidine kinase N-terminal domain-containing protein, partial [Burkholderiaceae bacterium]|nr:sensor histidine kinase N-terminal domain-containing protein [Burkholderiaceae bacterium]
MQHEQRSLFGEILDWMLAPLLLLWPMSVALTWLVAQNIANRPYDRALGETARLLSQRVEVVAIAAPPARAASASLDIDADAPPAETSTPPATVRFTLPPLAAELLRADDVDEVYFQVLGARGEFVSGDRNLPVPPDDERPRAGELHWRDDVLQGEPVRVAYLYVADSRGVGAPLVQVAETLGKRSRLAAEIIKGVILPQFVILPVAVLLVWLALARGIAPLNELQQRIRLRAADDLSPIDEHEAPEEVSPLVRAINDLLTRLDRSLATQKRFLANAAHQLKTPLAGLRTQAELAQREIDLGEADPQALRRSLQQIARSSQRAAHMVNQLLAMARAEDREAATPAQEINLSRLATETVRDYVPRALEHRLDLGYEGPDAEHCTRVLGHPVLLRELIRNLVDNAVHYTPAGGTVTVRVIDDPFGQVVVLQVEDNGPGVPAAEREMVFQPFYRALGTNVDGSGLGLAIVAE